ncbi:MAG TPA: rhomboid family intramembrane serine protease [Terrimicrobiaceae bacterium]|jgi:membrane associated rhomboid family serine protease
MTEKRRWVSAVGVLIAFNVGVFLYRLLRPDLNERLLELYALSGAGIEEGRWWQLLTHAFLHGNIWHLLFNMAGLWFAGRIVERVMGTGRFLALYIACAVAGGLAQLLLEGGSSLLLGASGAVCGVILAFATIFPEAQIVMLLFFVVPLRFRAKYLGWGLTGSSFLFFLVGFEPWIGHAAHLGGCVTGYLLARFNGYGVPTAPERLLKKWGSSRAT